MRDYTWTDEYGTRRLFGYWHAWRLGVWDGKEYGPDLSIGWSWEPPRDWLNVAYDDGREFARCL